MTCILVVEDEAIVATDIQLSLERAGYTVPRIVDTGEGAIVAARDLSPDLIMMDIRLIGPMDGIDAALRIRTAYQTPLIFLTAHSDAATLERARHAHPYGYLLKPFNEQELRSTIEIALYKSRHDRMFREQEQWLRTTLQAIGEGVIATNAAGRVRLINPVAEALTGWAKQEALGQELAEVFAVATTAEPEIGPLSASKELLSRTGTRIPVEDSVASIVDEEGTLLGAVLVFRDVAERKELERRLAAAGRLASIGTLAAGVAHEINNPLAYSIGNLEFVEEQVRRGVSLSDVPEARNALGEALNGARRVARIVNDLRHFARGASSNEPDVDTIIDLASTFDMAIKLSSVDTRHRAHVDVQLGKVPLIRGNEGRLCQVLVNLLTNAAHAMPRDRPMDENRIELVLRSVAGEGACIEVRDNGVGIPAPLLARIFDPFFTTKAVGSGSGLGLAVSHGIVAAMGGTLDVESVEDVGTVFRIRLPPARATPRELPRVTPPSESTASRRANVLIVDDEPALARFLSRVLRADHEVTTAGSGEEALALLAGGRRFDAIVCDLMMPGVSGIEVLERLESELPEQAARVLLLTGGAVTERGKELLTERQGRVLDKPVDLPALRAAIREVVG